jgi:hypothetical protein
MFLGIKRKHFSKEHCLFRLCYGNTLCALGRSIQQNESDMSYHKYSILKTRELQAGVQYYIPP